MQPVCRNSDYFDSLQEFCLQSGIHPIKNLFDLNTYIREKVLQESFLFSNDQSIGSTKAKYIKLNTKTQFFFVI